MKRGGKVGLGALGIMALFLIVGIVSFGNTIPWWYALPILFIVPACLLTAIFGLLTAYGDKLDNLLEHFVTWLEDE